uniref:G-patch domain-containing protein n=1 Tax=Clastoptera arizonana TaxID=38151 RepID=A0A1B6CYV9_9HEMI
MSEEGKKISFGFSKLMKKPSITSKNKIVETEKVQFIDCVEDKSIKIKNEEKKNNKLLLIPLVKNTKIPENVKTYNSTDKSIVDQSTIKIKLNESNKELLSSKQSVIETLDSIAAKEILEEVNKSVIEELPKIFTVPLTASAPVGEKESALEDYENIPVSDFGVAMLRGMGWSPGKGIGKNEKLVQSTQPTLRPKGMGLGADKVIKPSNQLTNNIKEELKLIKGGFVRIIAGPHRDSYGEIVGFDDESGRLFVKIALKNIVVSFNEFMVQVVNNNEFIKNSKVINVRMYEEFKGENKDKIHDKQLREISRVKNEQSFTQDYYEDIRRKENYSLKPDEKHKQNFINRSKDGNFQELDQPTRSKKSLRDESSSSDSSTKVESKNLLSRNKIDLNDSHHHYDSSQLYNFKKRVRSSSFDSDCSSKSSNHTCSKQSDLKKGNSKMSKKYRYNKSEIKPKKISHRSRSKSFDSDFKERKSSSKFHKVKKAHKDRDSSRSRYSSQQFKRSHSDSSDGHSNNANYSSRRNDKLKSRHKKK